MTVKQQLIAEIEEIDNPITLVQLFEVMQYIKQNTGQQNTLISRFADYLTDADAQEMRGIVDNEFNKIEGEW